MLLIVSAEVPVLVRVIDFEAPLFPIATTTQFNEVGLTVALPEPVAPVPLSATDCGLFVAESVKVSDAVRAPLAVGLNTMEAEQVPAAAKLVLQVLLAMLKSPAFVPEIATLLIVIDELVPFDKVTVCEALLDPTFVLANVRLVGLADTVPLAAVPVPVSVIVWGLPLAESLKTNVADRAPVACGTNATVAVQLEDAASDDPQVLLLIAKSPGFAPPRVTLLMVIAVLPLFVRVTTFGAPVWPSCTDTQFRVDGETETCAISAAGNKTQAAAARAIHVAKRDVPGASLKVRSTVRREIHADSIRANTQVTMAHPWSRSILSFQQETN